MTSESTDAACPPLTQLRDALRDFAVRRQWQPFHTPKNLAMGLSIEAAEVLELFQWLTPEQSSALPPPVREQLAQELGDVFIYLIMLADHCGIDPVKAAFDKMAINEAKYPVDKSRGVAKKYSEL
ncbi:MAG: nucleotide pyrophosphohydrolase [Magnetococcus sp. WYHC-3]